MLSLLEDEEELLWSRSGGWLMPICEQGGYRIYTVEDAARVEDSTEWHVYDLDAWRASRRLRASRFLGTRWIGHESKEAAC